MSTRVCALLILTGVEKQGEVDEIRDKIGKEGETPELQEELEAAPEFDVEG